MKTLNKIIVAMALAGVATVATAKVTEKDAVNENWKGQFPDQYNSWATTKETSEIVDLIKDDPNLAIMFAGYGFSKDYNKARGHYYALVDVMNTLRTGAPKGDTDGPMAAACWSCKAPDVPRMYDKIGEGTFNNNKWGKWGSEMSNSIGCADCHVPGSSENTMSRPYAKRAMEKRGLKFEEQEAEMQAAQTCGQCHVEYYFDKTDDKNVRFPWEVGFSGEDAETYYDGIKFKDWTHKISKAPMLKAQHPEFETWSTSSHAEMGVTCITCHMPKKENAKGQEYSDHNVGNALDAFDTTCADCHDSKAELKETIEANKAEINEQKLAAEVLIVRAHFEAKAAWDAGATEAEMAKSLDLIRKAQWRWDFAIASHGIAVHNPAEGLRLLEAAQDFGQQAQDELKKVLTKHGVKQPVALPDLSTKAAAQKAAMWDMKKLNADKKEFLEKRVKGEWNYQAH
ncbi:ammonia-forming cytochrome c nitrite reductase [uncultured Ferrimonas sp.]|uniref:ammonia-forming cytochrome c nitrite reductase n=1 Tax=uncultured Ferrimonas sp. TaxID=432640 RepID=UPI002613672C|nr:ammonia-forming cytochrome c nitrite reductase [uncultured Ferrimonas sp.]